MNERRLTQALSASAATLRAQKRARSELVWRDHGFLRLYFRNFHWLSPNLARCNQPSPEQLARYAAMGFRTVINLRGPSEGGQYLLERQACARLGLQLIDFPTRSNLPPSRDAALAARDLFATVQTPALMHCKSGSDRTGLMAVIYRHVILGDPMVSALDELGPRYLHVRYGKAGIIDAFFETYLADARDSYKPFMDWVVQDYDPAQLERRYKGGVWARGLIDLALAWALGESNPGLKIRP
jgi:protein tyrosine/serine phosphatase